MASLESTSAIERSEALATERARHERARDKRVGELEERIEAARVECSKAITAAQTTADRTRAARAASIVEEFYVIAGPLARQRHVEPSRVGDREIVAAFQRADARCTKETGESFSPLHVAGIFVDQAIEVHPASLIEFSKGEFSASPLGYSVGVAEALRAGDDFAALAAALDRVESHVWKIATRAARGAAPTEAHRARYAAIRNSAIARDATITCAALDKSERERRQAEYQASCALPEAAIAPPVTEGNALARLVERARGAISRAASAP